MPGQTSTAKWHHTTHGQAGSKAGATHGATNGQYLAKMVERTVSNTESCLVHGQWWHAHWSLEHCRLKETGNVPLIFTSVALAEVQENDWFKKHCVPAPLTRSRNCLEGLPMQIKKPLARVHRHASEK